jgi:hypothetical protein
MPDHVSTPEEMHVERFGNRGNSLLLSFLPALLVGRPLPNCDLVEGAPLGFHPDMGVAGKHGARNVPSDAHDHFAAPTRCRVVEQCQPAAAGAP